MDHKTTLEELKQEVKKFCEDRDWNQYHNPKDLAIMLITEASELLELFRFKSDEYIQGMFNDPDKSLAIKDELADVLYTLLRFAERHNLDLTTELRRKIKKNAVRYPVEKSKGINKKYTEL